MPDDPSDPILHELTLPCRAALAFATYTERIGAWWHPRYTANPDTLTAVTIEPHIGGRVFATHSDLGTHEWGEVTVWEPGRQVAHTFTLAQDPNHPSEVRVEFVPDPTDETAGCTVHFAHGGWTAANADARAKFGDWPVMLERFAALAGADQPPAPAVPPASAPQET